MWNALWQWVNTNYLRSSKKNIEDHCFVSGPSVLNMESYILESMEHSSHDRFILPRPLGNVIALLHTTDVSKYYKPTSSQDFEAGLRLQNDLHLQSLKVV